MRNRNRNLFWNSQSDASLALKVFGLVLLLFAVIELAAISSSSYNSGQNIGAQFAFSSKAYSKQSAFFLYSRPTLLQTVHPVTLVTAYFRIKSKHNHSEYDRWIENFLGRIQETPIIVHTTPDLVPRLKATRENCSNAGPTIYVKHKDVWSIPWLQRPVSAQTLPETSFESIESWRAAYMEQHSIDPERNIHNPELYAIWNSKGWMLADAANTNRFSSTYYFWVDIGSFRQTNHTFQKWPSVEIVERIMSGVNNRMLLSLISDPNLGFASKFHEELPPVQRDLVEGGFFGGSASTVQWWAQTFEHLHDKYYGLRLFVGKEQPLMSALFLQLPERFLAIPAFKSRESASCGDQWFYFQQLLAAANESSTGCQKYPLLAYF